jgi:hypothetical protein
MQPSALTQAQQLTIRQHLLDASVTEPVGFLWAVSLGQLADLAPVVQNLVNNSTDPIVTGEATSVQAAIAPAQASLSNAALLTLSQSWLDGSCLGFSGLRKLGCQVLDDEFAVAIKNVGGNAGAEKLILDALIVSANIAVKDGNISSTVGTIIVSNAKLVRSRL